MKQVDGEWVLLGAAVGFMIASHTVSVLGYLKRSKELSDDLNSLIEDIHETVAKYEVDNELFKEEHDEPDDRLDINAR